MKKTTLSFLAYISYFALNKYVDLVTSYFHFGGTAQSLISMFVYAWKFFILALLIICTLHTISKQVKWLVCVSIYLTIAVVSMIANPVLTSSVLEMIEFYITDVFTIVAAILINNDLELSINDIIPIE